MNTEYYLWIHKVDTYVRKHTYYLVTQTQLLGPQGLLGASRRWSDANVECGCRLSHLLLVGTGGYYTWHFADSFLCRRQSANWPAFAAGKTDKGKTWM